MKSPFTCRCCTTRLQSAAHATIALNDKARTVPDDFIPDRTLRLAPRDHQMLQARSSGDLKANLPPLAGPGQTFVDFLNEEIERVRRLVLELVEQRGRLGGARAGRLMRAL